MPPKTSKNKITLVLALMAFAAAGKLSPQTPRVSATYSVKRSQRATLTASVDSPTIKTGSPVTIHITLKNISAETVRLMETYPEQDFEITVVDASGTEIKKTEYGRNLREERKAFRRVLVLMKPDEEVEASVEISKIYHLSKPEVYYSRVMRALLPESDSKGDLRVQEKAVSNPVIFTVVD